MIYTTILNQFNQSDNSICARNLETQYILDQIFCGKANDDYLEDKQDFYDEENYYKDYKNTWHSIFIEYNYNWIWLTMKGDTSCWHTI